MTSISLRPNKIYKVDPTSYEPNIFRKAPTDLSLYIITYLDGNDRSSLKNTGRFEHSLVKKQFKHDLVQIRRFTNYPKYTDQERLVFLIWKNCLHHLYDISFCDDTSFTPEYINRYHPDNIRKLKNNILNKYYARNYVRFWKKAITNVEFSEVIPSLRCTFTEVIRYFLHYIQSETYPDKAIKLLMYVKKIFNSFPEKADSISTLDLSSANLTVEPIIYIFFKNITNLNLSHNKIFYIRKQIKNLTKLRNLNFQRNRIRELPLQIFELSQLRKLSLAKNNISTLPKEIGNLTNLQSLSISSNCIATIPEEIRHLTNLEELDLSYNNLRTIAEGIKELLNLNDLNISGNRFSAFPHQLLGLRRLTVLDFSENDITELPVTICNLTALRSLKAYANTLEMETSLPQIGNLIELESLDLSNHIFEIIPDSFKRLENLQSLDLAGNCFTNFPEPLYSLTNLRKLLLQDNSIKHISNQIINLQNLNELNLECNLIESISREIREFFASIQNLNMYGNPCEENTCVQ